jgi:hypothetical protein
MSARAHTRTRTHAQPTRLCTSVKWTKGQKKYTWPPDGRRRHAPAAIVLPLPPPTPPALTPSHSDSSFPFRFSTKYTRAFLFPFHELLVAPRRTASLLLAPKPIVSPFLQARTQDRGGFTLRRLFGRAQLDLRVIGGGLRRLISPVTR